MSDKNTLPNVTSINKLLSSVQFLKDRTPEMTDDDVKDAFALVSEYRDGAIYVGHYAGYSEWERHPQGDELVFVIEGETTLFLLIGNDEIPNRLSQGELLVVPENVWHRFETPKGVKIMAITPQPTEHSIEKPVER